MFDDFAAGAMKSDIAKNEYLEDPDEEILPELLQSKCNSENIFIKVDQLLSNEEELKKQIMNFQVIIDKFKTDQPSKIASSILVNHF